MYGSMQLTYRNLGHTLNDVFNVWMMLWLEGLAPYARQVDLLNVDSFKLGLIWWIGLIW